jgi:hypothetical protein
VSERTARLATSMLNDQHPNEMIVGPMIVRTNEASTGTTATASKAGLL